MARITVRLAETLHVLVVAFVLCWSMPAYTEINESPPIDVEIHTSPVLSLLYFTRAALGRRHISVHLREIYEANADEKHARALSKIRRVLDRRFVAQYGGDDLSGRHDVGLESLLELRAGLSTDIDDFGDRTAGLLPVAAHAELIGGLRVLEPLHDEHVWKPARPFLGSMERRLGRQAARAKMGERLAAAARLYGTQWPSLVPIRIHLVPVPGKVERTQAHSIGAVQVVEVVDGDDVAGRLGVLFHEICHGFYRARSPEARRVMSEAFERHPLPIARLAQQQLNEGLATALGNGWFEWVQKGDRVFEENWYADEAVDAYARKLFPLVRYYLEQGGTIDDGFVNRAVALFHLAVPEAYDRPDLLFGNVLLITSAKIDHAVAREALQSNFRVSSLWSSSPVGHEKTRENYARTAGTPVFVLTPSDAPSLEQYPFSPELETRLEELFDRGPFLLRTDDGDGRSKIVVGVIVADDVEPLFEQLAASRRVRNGTVLRMVIPERREGGLLEGE